MAMREARLRLPGLSAIHSSSRPRPLQSSVYDEKRICRPSRLRLLIPKSASRPAESRKSPRASRSHRRRAPRPPTFPPLLALRRAAPGKIGLRPRRLATRDLSRRLRQRRPAISHWIRRRRTNRPSSRRHMAARAPRQIPGSRRSKRFPPLLHNERRRAAHRRHSSRFHRGAQTSRVTATATTDIVRRQILPRSCKRRERASTRPVRSARRLRPRLVRLRRYHPSIDRANRGRRLRSRIDSNRRWLRPHSARRRHYDRLQTMVETPSRHSTCEVRRYLLIAELRRRARTAHAT
jgi:hypothetical protein